MALNLSFESEEEILGIVVSKPTDNVNTIIASPELAKINELLECHYCLNESIVILTKYIDDF